MTVIDEENTEERVEKMDKNTQSTLGTKQLCFLLRQRIEQCVVSIKTSAIAEELVKAYTNHPGLFVVSLMLVASVLIPIMIVSAIISIHIVLGVVVFITLEAIVILSSTAFISFVFLFVFGALAMMSVSLLTIYLGAHWLLNKFECVKTGKLWKTFCYGLVQY